MVSKKEAIREAVEVVPQWYISDESSRPDFTVAIGSQSLGVKAHRPPRKGVEQYQKVVNEHLSDIYSERQSLPKQVAREAIQRALVEKWLRSLESGVDWRSLINYIDELKNRTYENDAVVVNLLVQPSSDGGTGIINTPEKQLILDSLASSLHSYFRISGNLQFMEYAEVNWNTIQEPETRRFYPSFLHPLFSTLEPGEFSIHLTRNREVLIMDSDEGVVATRRKGKWKIYAPTEIYGSMIEILDLTPTLAENVHEIAFDLSFKRHGALLVYDPENRISVDELANDDECQVDNTHSIGDKARNMLSPSIHNLALGEESSAERRHRIFSEIASMDGAVIFDRDRIKAFGAMLRVHDKARDEKGARTTAARSAYHLGAYPIKVSTDGGVTVLFADNAHATRQEKPRKLSLL